jgi:hypothetical protein
MGPSSVQAGVASHGVEAVAKYLVAGEGFIVGGNAWGPPMKLKGSVIYKGSTAPPLAFAQ